MKRVFSLFLLAVLCASASHAQTPAQFVPDSLTRGLWHFNESTGQLAADTSAFGSTGAVFGTVIVPGRFGNARSFSGAGDYVTIPSGPALDFDSSSFRIDLWMKTASPEGAIILRRGLAPDPGYMISVAAGGKIVGMIGDRADSHWPDTLESVWSDSSFSDNKWHHVTFIRDRSVHKLYLYIDSLLAAKPSDDNFTIPLNSSDPLTIGRWESPVYPTYFAGSVDEVRLTNDTPGVFRMGPQASIGL